MAEYNHEELIARARRWLENSLRCRFVLTNAFTSGEIPDAIGWAYGVSHLLECKTSVNDFYADRRKPWRRSRGLGLYRWYMTPPGLLQPQRLPALWGLLEVHAKCVRRVVRARRVPLGWWRYEAELDLLAKRAVATEGAEPKKS